MQAGILAIASLISRIIGLLYGSPLTAIIGDEGNGYYSTAYNLYSIVLLISSYSIPSAMSKIISQKLAVKEYRNAQRIFRCALIYVFVVGGLGSLLLFFGAGLFVDGYAVPVLRTFAPFIFIFGPLGVLRGYFQAHRTMVPTSISQVLEQICNAIVSLSAAYFLIQMVKGQGSSIEARNGAIGSALGTGSGIVIALIFMLVTYLVNKGFIDRRAAADKHDDLSYKDIFGLIFKIVTPFILSTFIYNYSATFNSTLFSKILIYVKGIASSDVMTSYGIYARKANVIANLPITMASATAAAMMPNVSTLFATGDVEGTKKLCDKALRVVLMIAIPSAAGLMFLARPIMMLLFPQKSSLSEAAFLLALLSISVVFYSISTVSNSILQGVGKVVTPVINAAIALVIQSVFLVVMLIFTDMGNRALCLAAIVYSLCMCILNELSIKKAINIRQDFRKTYLIPGACAVVMGIAGRLVYELLHIPFGFVLGADGYFTNLFAVGFAIIVAVIVYAFMLVRLHGITEEELYSFPKGTKLVSILKKIRIL